MDRKSSIGNPNPDKPRLAFHFLRALARINLNTPMSSSLKRSRRIRRAAYASMAYAAGSKSTWSRAVLCRRARLRAMSNRRVRVVVSRQRESAGRTNTLRRLVPGGEGMDLCSLLEETADYIQCLSSQVQLMKTVADSMSL